MLDPPEITPCTPRKSNYPLASLNKSSPVFASVDFSVVMIVAVSLFFWDVEMHLRLRGTVANKFRRVTALFKRIIAAISENIN